MFCQRKSSDNAIMGPSLFLFDSIKILSKCCSKAYVPRLSPLTNKLTYLYFNDGKPFSFKSR